MEELEEKKRKKKAWMVSIGIQFFLLVLFYFLAAWRAPDPPNPEFGIELNFGIQETGGGNTPVTSSEPDQPDEPEEEASQENTQEEVQDTDESEVQDEPMETYENPDPDVVQEETTSSSAQEREEPVETEEPENEASQPAATYSPDTNTSQGDTGGEGDQGDPEGDINEEALYGTPGGGEDGSSLQMSGWEWDSPPEPKDASDETGKIVFEIIVDSDGYLESYKVLTSTVSPSVKQQYSLAVEQLTFSKTSSYSSAPSSKGIITFIIRSR